MIDTVEPTAPEVDLWVDLGEDGNSLGDLDLRYLMPTGFIGDWPTAVAPAGWALCDGSPHGSAALQSVLAAGGLPNPQNTPDLRDLFIVAAGGSYAVGDTGGAASVTLTAAQSGSPSHTHPNSSHTHTVDPPATDSGTVSSWHTHSFTTGTESADHAHTTGWMDRNASHAHSAVTREGLTSGDSNSWIDSADSDGSGTLRTDTVVIYATDTNHLHGTGGRNAAHTHSGTTGNPSANHYHSVDIPAFTSGSGTTSTPASTAANATASHENRPPFYALTKIIKL